MQLILTPWKNRLLERVRAARSSILLISPFIKTNIANGLLSAVSNPGVTVKTVTRCKVGDFACGASDIDAAFGLSSFSTGIAVPREIRFDNRLHAKIFVFDDEAAYVGSSNLTFSGLERNYEAVVEISDRTSLKQVMDEANRYWNDARPATADSFNQARSELYRLVRTTRMPPVQDEHFYQSVLPDGTAVKDPVLDTSPIVEAEASVVVDLEINQIERLTDQIEPIAPDKAPFRVETFIAQANNVVTLFLEVLKNRFDLQTDKGHRYGQLLQEVAQAFGSTLPAYQFTRSGPAHTAEFRCIAQWQSFKAIGVGASKIAARSRACHEILVRLAAARDSGDLPEPEKREKKINTQAQEED